MKLEFLIREFQFIQVPSIRRFRFFTLRNIFAISKEAFLISETLSSMIFFACERGRDLIYSLALSSFFNAWEKKSIVEDGGKKRDSTCDILNSIWKKLKWKLTWLCAESRGRVVNFRSNLVFHFDEILRKPFIEWNFTTFPLSSFQKYKGEGGWMFINIAEEWRKSCDVIRFLFIHDVKGKTRRNEKKKIVWGKWWATFNSFKRLNESDDGWSWQKRNHFKVF